MSARFEGARTHELHTEACDWRSEGFVGPDGVLVFRASAVVRAATRVRHVAAELPPGLSLHVVRSGAYGCRLAGIRQPVSMDISRHGWLMPAANDIEFSVAPGTQVDNLSVRVPDAWLADLAASYGGPLPLSRLADGGACDPFFRPLASDQALARVASDLLANAFTGPARRLYFEAKILELLALGLQRIGSCEPRRGEGGIDPATRRKIAAARDRLAADPLDPPSLAALARSVGLTSRRLAQGFRAVFGVSTLQWLRDARLDLGRAMLAEDVPLKQVAARLGYSHVNNFTIAFRARFGEPPGRCRRSGRVAGPRRST